MAAIWISDELGAYTGPFGRDYIDTESPGCMVKIVGWILLVGLPSFSVIYQAICAKNIE